MDYSSEGKLQIKASAAGGALPIEGVSVRISGAEEGNIGVEYSLITGRSGLTTTASLPTPNPAFSEAPRSPEQAYALYDVYAYKDGYYPKEIKDVAIFGSVKSILALNMIPDAGLTRNNNAPHSSNNSIITENEDLN